MRRRRGKSMGAAFVGLGFVATAGGCGERVRVVPVGPGWSRNSVNAVIFRQHAVTTHDYTQYTAFYDGESRVVLAKRRLGATEWETRVTPYKGNTGDAHNAICIAVDGTGILHVAWDHHNHPLRYARSVEPGSLELTDKLPMTGRNEARLCYPEFYDLDDGGLLFMYRDGSSGNGNTMLNRYDPATRTWSVVQHPLIDGEGGRNAYTNQIAIDGKGVWHLSWNWRETGGVQTNHDICYARSGDEGKTWEKSTGEAYTLPITETNAEVVCPIPQDSELINHTTTVADSRGRPLIATYWRPEGTDVPQYHLIWHDGKRWHTTQVGHRRTPFRLSGIGTRRIPISRPKLAIDPQDRIYMFFRDEERGDGVSVAICDDPDRARWRFVALTTESLGRWEPNYDAVLWRRDGVFHIFTQYVAQRDRDRLVDLPPQMVSILEWKP